MCIYSIFLPEQGSQDMEVEIVTHGGSGSRKGLDGLCQGGTATGMWEAYKRVLHH